MKYIKWFNEISMNDLSLVGGKNSSLGEMVRALKKKGVSVPQGFAITVDGFKRFIEANNFQEIFSKHLGHLDVNDTVSVAAAGKFIREHMITGIMPEDLADEIRESYQRLCFESDNIELAVAVRSSATAEDLPDASFAGLQETFLNVHGESELINFCIRCFASLYTDRAISYRMTKNIPHSQVFLSVGVQQMVRSDLASSGVMFTLDTETGARNVILINSSYGLGENIVGGKVEPDEFIVLKDLLNSEFIPILRRRTGSKLQKLLYSDTDKKSTVNKPVAVSDQKKLSLSDEDVLTLSRWAVIIEKHYSWLGGISTPMDIEWAKDGETGQLFILQARPETVYSRLSAQEFTVFSLDKKSKVLVKGRAVGSKIGSGAVKIIRSISDFKTFQNGDILVADMTDPDWEPIMKKAAAVVTNSGGRTCHAAIISRELGVPCIVGTKSATTVLKEGDKVTVCCSEGDEGLVYEGILPFHEKKLTWDPQDKTKTKVMVNLANPAQALQTSLLPVDGIGLVRMEFIISEMIRIHPMALAHLNQIQDHNIRSKISELLGSGNDPEKYFIEKLSEGLAMIAGAFYPRPVIVRFSDFKSNEYANLIGGTYFEENEENPMIGFRGASRYYDESYSDGFSLECQAIKHLREETGLTNIKVMIPFCRSPEEGQKVIDEMAKSGLVRHENGLEIYVMSEIPSNVLRASEFSRLFDGFSIGSNDLTQMILAVDRDSSKISQLFNERDPAVLTMISMAIAEARKAHRPIGICGQAPSDYPEFSRFLIKAGITSISVTADAVFKTLQVVLNAEKELNKTDESRHL
jgi:pyruvate,water dikinase